ncbi:MAG: hypothetical protein Q8N10_03180 [Phenylobacterium sp.]|uniref:hypothetical protein n=1 Tax=Phenylobacterium sp. TaxID=1871053 RepID=UPI00271CCD4F|nr:hypothetical protein [Phenylobacterium sp.]MDO8912273.1 hypothetical protein [Phenylobacterium sp.]MDP3099485.1 hypothetical protein [Phenylobacterium sp.]
MHANDNTARPPELVPIIGVLGEGGVVTLVRPGFNLRAATAALRTKPRLRLVGDDIPTGL